ncbi:hypothetical protein PVAND_005984 [Polypedilum vanderplanki]|uniref:Uncharacterized protein n=1 Tax=Polypedilum vanderplanki TaxID=319348 RepID=A0A9J6C2M6_POLVA|nr:hypothetical protein PVAND_005984 [Polypedilum vanderplanki]
MISLGFLILGLNFLSYQKSENERNNQTQTKNVFDEYCNDFNKSYHSKQEYGVRKEIFLKNLNAINKHNGNNSETYKMSINQFTDMTFKELYDLNYPDEGESSSKMDTTKYTSPETENLLSDSFEENVPDSFDWRNFDVISNIKDQKLCGSCFIYAVLEEIESQIKIKTNQSYEFSRQEILDCARKGYGSLGCSGGSLYGVHSYIKNRGGISEEKFYPYEAKENLCRSEKFPKIDIDLKGIKIFDTEDEDILKRALYTLGPITVIIDNLHDSFFRYSSGIYYEQECNESDAYSHAVVIIGYGSSNGKDYWTIKNSYGEKWGEKGYMRIARNQNNHCKISSFNMVTKL